METLNKALISAVGSVIAYVYGGWSILLEALLVLIVADYVTGLIAAGVSRTLSSRVGFTGIGRKLMILIMVAVAHVIDLLVNNSGMIAELGMTALGEQPENNFVMNAAIIFYCVNELLSITENAGRAGIKIPTVLTRMIDVLKPKDEPKDDDKK